MKTADYRTNVITSRTCPPLLAVAAALLLATARDTPAQTNTVGNQFIRSSQTTTAGTLNINPDGNGTAVRLGFASNITWLLTNAGTVVNANGKFVNSVGNAPANNGTIIAGGAVINVTSDFFNGYDDARNTFLTIVGAGSQLNVSGVSGFYWNSFNSPYATLTLSNGGVLATGPGKAGGSPKGLGSRVYITGANSLWTYSSSTTLEFGYVSGSMLVLSDGGALSAPNAIVEFKAADPSGPSRLQGNGTVTARNLLFADRGRLTPEGTAPLTINGNLSFNTGFFDWNLFANSTNNPGTDFTRPIVLNGDISGVTSSRLVVNLTNSVASGEFWDTSRAWDLITTTSGNLGLGTRFDLSFTGNTNGITLANFSLLSTNNALRLVYNAPAPVPPEFYWNTNVVGAWTTAGNWSANAVPGSTNTAFINHGGTSTLSSAATVGAVVIGSTNGSTGGNLTLTNGGTLTASNVTVASAAGSTGSLNFNGGSLAAPTIAFGSGTGSVNFNQTGALSVTSVISGNGTVRQVGSGTTTLSGVNTYSGGTTVSNGVLQAGANGAFSANSTFTLNGGTIDLRGTTNSITALEILSGNHLQTDGRLTTTLPGLERALRFAANPGSSATYTLDGGYLGTLNGGQFQLGFRGDAVFNQNGGTNNISGWTILGRWSPGGTGTYNLNSGLFQQSSANHRSIIGEDGTGVMNVNGGVYSNAGKILIASTANAIGTLNIRSNGVVITPEVQFGAGIGLLNFDREDAYTFVAPITGNGRVEKNGTGTVTLSGQNTYTGGTVVSNGTLAVTGKLANNAGNTVTVNSNASFVFANNDVFGVHSTTVIAPIVINGGTVRNSGSFYNALGPITMNGGTLAALDTIFGLSFSLKGLVTVNSNSTISGPGISLGAAAVTGTTFNVANGANLTVDSGLLNGWSVNINPPNPSFLTKTGAGTMQLNGTNTYTGTTTISAGTLSLGGAGVLGGGNYSGSIVNSGTFVVGTTANQILGGVISGSGALVKDAAGTLTLDGIKTYTGTTTINAGTLLLNGEHTGGAGYTVNSGGTLGGLGITTSSVTVADGADITPGAGGTEELVIGGLTLDGRLNVFLDGESTSLLSVLGNATLGGNSSVSFSQGPNALTAPIYVFLAATNGITSTFSATNGVPTGYGVFYDVNDGIAFLKDNTVANVAAAIFEGENAVIGNGSTNFSVYAFNGGTASATFTATAGALTTGGPLSTNITASNGVELSSLTFTGPGTNFGTNTGTFTADFNGQTNTVEYDVVVYDNARGSLVTSATNPATVSLGSAIVGYTNPLGGNVTVSNAPGFRVALGAAGSSTNGNLSFTDARDIEAGTTGNLLFALAGQGAGQFTNTVDVRFFDDSTLSGASTNLGTTTFTVTGAIYNHALAVTNGTNLAFRPVHQNAGGLLIATNSINISNQSGFRVALGSENTYTNSGLTVGSVQDLAEGQSRNIGAVYDLDLVSVAGQFTNFVDVRFFDDSTLDGASTNVGTATIAVSGYVYTGKGIWTGNGTNWAAITNWLAPGGTPGLDGAFSVNDTATFDTNGTSYTVNLAEDAGLRAITFSNTANAYTIGGAGDISLTAASEGSATLANLAGTHTISNNIRMGSTLEVTNASGTQLTVAGVLSGFEGFTKSGPGTLTLAGANTYSGTTTVTGGTLQATTNGAFSSQSGVVLNGGTIDIGATTQVLPSLNIVTGTHNQTNGTLSVVTASSSDSLLLASQAGGTVVYNLSGGTLSTTNSNLQVGWLGNATFNQTGGVVDIDGYFVLGRFANATGTYDLSAGTATQSSAARNMIIGEDGIGSMTVGGSGVLTDAGIIQLGLGNGSGTLRITNNGVVDAQGINLGWRDVNRLIFDLTAVETNFSVPITGAGSVVKAGSGTVVFDQNNSYGGTTTISNGTLVVNGLHSGTGAYTVQNSGILAGTGQISAPVTVQSGGTINPGLTTPGEEFIIGNNLTLEAGGILNVFLGGGTTSQLQVGGNVVLNAGSIVNFSNTATLTDSLYPFLTYGGSISGAFSTNATLPSGFELITNSSDKVVALLRSSVDLAVSPIFNGENAVITGGTLPFGVFVYNNTNVTVGFTAAGGLNTTGAVSSVTLAPETSDIGNGLEWSGTNVGLNQAGNFAVTFTNGSGLNQTNTVAVTVSVYDHALAQYAPGNTNLSFAPVHARNTNPVATTNSISVANATGDRVNLGVRVEDNTNSAVTIGDVGGVAAGASTEITGLLEPTLVDNPGRFTNTVQLVSFDDSDLNGASVALSTNTIIVTGYIYTGQGEWNTLGGGNWADIGQWQVPGGTPGLDGEYSVNDTALFGANGSGTVTNDGSVQMLSMTFSNALSYTIGGNGTINLTASGANDAAITTLAGAHTISNAIEIGSDLVLSNATGTLLTLAKPVEGPFGLTKEGEGTTTLSAANTYTGGTTVNGGLLNINAGRGLANVSSNALVINEGIVSFNNNDVFGQHYDAINAPVTINAGGILMSGGAFYNTLGSVTLNGGSIVAAAPHSGGYSFAFKDDVIVTGTNISTLSGAGLALGADNADSTRFDVADGATLFVSGTLVDGPSGPDYNVSQPSRLIKDGSGEMILTSNNSFNGGTVIEAGTLTTRNSEALGSTADVAINGGTLGLENGLTITSLIWDSAGYVGMKDAVLDDVFLNITGNLALAGGAPHYFDLTGDFVGSNPTKLMSAANLSAFEATQFDILGGLPGDYILSISNNTLWIASDVLIVDGTMQASGTNSFGSARFVAGSDPVLDVPSGSSVTIRTNVAISNNAFVNVAGGAFGVTNPANSITVQSDSSIGGFGTINGAVNVSGAYAPGAGGNGTILTNNGALTFNSGGSFVWTLYANTNTLPGENFSSITALGANKLTVPEDTEFQMFFTDVIDATNDFWDANEFLTNTWTVMTGTDLAEGTAFRPVFAEGSVTNGFNPTTFFFRVTNNSLTLNYSPGLVVFPGPDEFLPGNNNYPWVVFEPNAELEVPVGVNVVIKTNVTISNNSTVLINGQFTSLAGQFAMQNGSSLGGNGTINGNLVSSGLISPGNSPGTLSIGGNFTQTAAGTFLLEAASLSNFDRLNVTGAAQVDGTLQAVGFGGNNLSPGDRYQFLTANGGISGDFDTISLPAGLRGSFLISGVNNSLGTLLIAPSTYTSMALTPNQFNAAQALDNFIGSGGDRGTVSAALDTLNASQYPAAFEQVMPSQYASLPTMAFNVANALNSSMFQQLWVIRVNGKGFNASGVNMAPMQAEMGGTDDMGVFAINPSKDTKWSSFVDGNGVFANASSTGSVQNYRSQSGGVSTGAAYSWTDAFATGVYVGYQGLQAEYDSGRTIDNAVRFGVFGTYDIEDFYFNALVGGAYHGYTVNRYINFGGLNRTATGRPGAGEFDLALGTGYDFDIGNFSWGPFTTLQYTYMAVQGFTEAGADSLNLDVDPYNSSSLLYTLGAQAAYNWKVSDRVIITPTAFAGWQHEFLQNGYTINSSFATGGPAAPFNYNTSSPARDNFYGGVGVTVGVGESWQATFIYSAAAANQDNSSQNLYLGVGYKF